MDGIRLAFCCGRWRPSQREWVLASQCILPEEKERIRKFVFKKDAKSAMAGRLLIRRCINDSLQIPNNEMKFERTEKGKPYLMNNVTCSMFNFNVSHQGEYAVLAADFDHQVGIDIMKVDAPRNKPVLDFFTTMRRQFTNHEWRTIKASPDEATQLKMFYRHWCLKESLVKAVGIGIGYEVQRLEFHLRTLHLHSDQYVVDTTVHIDGQKNHAWSFEEIMLDGSHCVSVALQNNDKGKQESKQNGSAVPRFRHLDFDELVDGLVPLTNPDTDYWKDFDIKHETPFT